MHLDTNPNSLVPTKLVVVPPGHAYALATTWLALCTSRSEAKSIFAFENQSSPQLVGKAGKERKNSISNHRLQSRMRRYQVLLIPLEILGDLQL